MQRSERTKKNVLLAIITALTVVLVSTIRIPGLAPMSTVINILGGLLLGPIGIMMVATITAIIRMLFLAVTPLAFTGAFFGAALAGILYKKFRSFWAAAIGEIVGTALIGSLTSYPVMVWYTGTTSELHWFIYTPPFFTATMIGSVIAWLVYNSLKRTKYIEEFQCLFYGRFLDKEG